MKEYTILTEDSSNLLIGLGTTLLVGSMLSRKNRDWMKSKFTGIKNFFIKSPKLKQQKLDDTKARLIDNELKRLEKRYGYKLRKLLNEYDKTVRIKLSELTEFHNYAKNAENIDLITFKLDTKTKVNFTNKQDFLNSYESALRKKEKQGQLIDVETIKVPKVKKFIVGDEERFKTIDIKRPPKVAVSLLEYKTLKYKKMIDTLKSTILDVKHTNDFTKANREDIYWVIHNKYKVIKDAIKDDPTLKDLMNNFYSGTYFDKRISVLLSSYNTDSRLSPREKEYISRFMSKYAMILSSETVDRMNNRIKTINFKIDRDASKIQKIKDEFILTPKEEIALREKDKLQNYNTSRKYKDEDIKQLKKQIDNLKQLNKLFIDKVRLLVSEEDFISLKNTGFFDPVKFDIEV